MLFRRIVEHALPCRSRVAQFRVRLFACALHVHPSVADFKAVL